MKRTAAGQMRLQREARMAKKEIETQIKKSGKITDNFICLPDPENAYIWYYVVFGLDIDGFRGGYYFGKIICPDEYPSKPPKIILITPNGRFHTWDNGICLSISDYHPESWNAAWKVNQIVIGLLSFWMQNEEYTYGAVSDHEKRELDPECDELNLTFTQVRTKLAMKSIQKVREHEMFKKIFEEFADVLGINTETEKPNEWIELEKVLEAHRKKKEEEAEQKRIEEELKKAEEERLRFEQEEKAKLSVFKDFFKALAKKDLTKFVGKPEKLKQLRPQGIKV